MEGRRPSDNWDWPLAKKDGMVFLKNDSRHFEADLEIPNFRANEVEVKVLNDELVIHAYKDQGGGRTPREIHRTYKLPPDVDLHSLKSNVKNDGTLQILASKKKF